jgi:hypothetical protein
MTLGSKDHYDAIAMFDKIARSLPARNFRLDKENRAMWKKGIVYQDDAANVAFAAFLQGVAWGRATA